MAICWRDVITDTALPEREGNRQLHLIIKPGPDMRSRFVRNEKVESFLEGNYLGCKVSLQATHNF